MVEGNQRVCLIYILDLQLRARVKIEGEKRKKHTSATAPGSASASGNNANSSSDSDDSGGSDSDEATPALPSFSATTRLTLSERFGKMAQWSIDRSNMENMRITKDSAGGALKVMIEEGMESPPRRYSYSPAPAGHFPEELATTAPSGMLSWDDVRVRYEYYKSRGYLRDLDLKVSSATNTARLCIIDNSNIFPSLFYRTISNGRNGGINIRNG